MNLQKFIFLVISIVHFSQCAVIEEYKTYKDYKLFQVTSLDGVKDLIKDLMEIDVSTFLTPCNCWDLRDIPFNEGGATLSSDYVELKQNFIT